MTFASGSRRLALVVAPLAAIAVIFAPIGRVNTSLSEVAAAKMGFAAAEPAAPMAAGSNSGDDDEGGTPLLRDVIEKTSRQFFEAQTAVETSKARQQQLTAELNRVEKRIAELTVEVRDLAAVAYRTGRLSATAALLNSSSPDTFLARVSAVDLLATRDDQTLRALHEAQRQASDAKQAIDAEVAEQNKQLAVMATQKRDAERALVLAGGQSTGGYVVATSPVAKPAPRNSNGSWPSQGCTVKDPTGTGGCITPRMLHSYQQARAAGFTRFVACYRSGGPYEHPKGRACDFSVQARTGFGGEATGQDRIYGNNLAAFFVRNASRLGVLYVIWFKQIWTPAVGWHRYGGAYGDASSNHTNHVHLSVL